jgi:hypothetical protein
MATTSKVQSSSSLESNQELRNENDLTTDPQFDEIKYGGVKIREVH